MSEVYSVSGDWDLVAIVRVPQYEQIAHVVTEVFPTVPGIQRTQTLTAFRDVCWYSWPEQTRSMERLAAYRFEWVLPGHGRIHHASAAEMHAHLERCVEWMKGGRHAAV